VARLPLDQLRKCRPPRLQSLPTHHCILRRLRHPEFHHRLRRNLDRGTSFRIAAHPSLALLLHQLANTRQCKFSILLHLAQSDLGDHVEEEPGGLAVGVGFLGDLLQEGGLGELFARLNQMCPKQSKSACRARAIRANGVRDAVEQLRLATADPFAVESTLNMKEND